MDGKVRDAKIDIKYTLDEVIARLNDLNKPDAPTRCREYSLAITKIEEALHWLEAKK